MDCLLETFHNVSLYGWSVCLSSLKHVSMSVCCMSVICLSVCPLAGICICCMSVICLSVCPLAGICICCMSVICLSVCPLAGICCWCTASSCLFFSLHVFHSSCYLSVYSMRLVSLWVGRNSLSSRYGIPCTEQCTVCAQIESPLK